MSLAVYTGTFCNSVLKAILVAFAIILAAGFSLQVAIRAFVDVATGRLDSEKLALLACAGLAVLVALVQRFAFTNFRRPEVPLRRRAGQLAFFLVGAILLSLMTLYLSLD